MDRAARPSSRRALALALSVALIQPGVPAADPYRLPDLGSSADTALSSLEQRELSRAFMRSVRKALSFDSDPLLNDYLHTLGQRLVAASGASDGFVFFLINEPAANAFAGPGGHIGVFTGLILATTAESELAAVLAHEIAHVKQKHLLRMFESQRRQALPTVALLIAAALLGARVEGQVGAAAMAGVQAAAAQSRLNFTRDHEEEADRIGIEILAQAGYDPYALPGFFENLGKSTRFEERSAPELLRTHPVTAGRIADGLARAERYGHRQQADALGFHLTRAALRERGYARAPAAVEHFRATLTQGRYRHETAERYGLALALTRDGRLEAAAQEADRLLAAAPRQVEFVVLRARIEQRAGALEAALRRLREARAPAPDNWPLTVALAETLLAAQRPEEALRALEQFNRLRPEIDAVYELMADTAARAGQRVQAHWYRGEALYRLGDLESAIRQLELALRQPHVPFPLAARVETRLAAWRDEERASKPLRARFGSQQP